MLYFLQKSISLNPSSPFEWDATLLYKYLGTVIPHLYSTTKFQIARNIFGYKYVLILTFLFGSKFDKPSSNAIHPADCISSNSIPIVLSENLLAIELTIQ